MSVRTLKTAVATVLGYAARAYAHLRGRYPTVVRWILGVGFVIGGFLAVLPVFGLWMLPVGLALLSDDVPPLRRLRRRLHARVLAWAKNRKRRPRIQRGKRAERLHSRIEAGPKAGAPAACTGRAD